MSAETLQAIPTTLPNQAHSMPFLNFQISNITPNQRVEVPIYDVASKALELKPEKNQVYPYSAEAAHLTAVASTWAYADAQMLSNVMKQAGLQNNAIDEVRVVNPALFLDTNAFLIRDPDKGIAILAFRGTEIGSANYIDMLTDINVDPVSFPKNTAAHVHGGFYRDLIASWPQLLEAINDCFVVNNKVTDLYITGHSLGGALAVMATAAIFMNTQDQFYGVESIRKRFKFRGTYTFGQPIVGDAQFAKLAEKEIGERLFRHVYHRDLIPRLPAISMGRFKHFGVEYRSKGKHQPWKRSPRVTQPVLSVAISLPVAATAFIAKQFGFSRDIPFTVSLADHFPQNYINAGKKVDATVQFP